MIRLADVIVMVPVVYARCDEQVVRGGREKWKLILPMRRGRLLAR